MTSSQLPDDHPVFQICKTGDAPALKRLLNDGLDVYTEGKREPRITGSVVHNGHEELLGLLVAHGLDVNRPFNKFGERLIFVAIRAKNPSMVECLIRNGADVRLGSAFGASPLQIAAAGGMPDIIPLLLWHGAEVSSKNDSGATPFFEAARNDQTESMDLLVKAGAKTAEPDLDGTTPLIISAKANKTKALQWLLERGADVKTKDSYGKTAMDWARENGHAEATRLLEGR